MMALRSPGRLATAVGLAVAAVAATALAVTAGVAQAAPEPGRCTDNVNIREQPKLTAPAFDLCRTGTRVTVEERRNGFVKLREFSTERREGWASASYVETGAPTSSGSSSTSATASRRAATSAASATSSRSTTTTTSTAASRSAAPRSTVPTEDRAPAADEPTGPPQRGGYGGLLG